jgi:hypothetical protein
MGVPGRLLCGVEGLLKWTSRGLTQVLFLSLVNDFGDGKGGAMYTPPPSPKLVTLTLLLLAKLSRRSASDGCKCSGDGFVFALGREVMLPFLDELGLAFLMVSVQSTTLAPGASLYDGAGELDLEKVTTDTFPICWPGLIALIP